MLGVGAVALPVPPVAAVYHKRLVPVAVNALAVASIQYEKGITVGAEGEALIVTSIFALALSQLLAFEFVTQYEVVPAVVVLGVGAVELPVPPVAVVYHFKLSPVAVKVLAVAF